MMACKLASSRLKPGLRAASELARPDVLGINRAETTVFHGVTVLKWRLDG